MPIDLIFDTRVPDPEGACDAVRRALPQAIEHPSAGGFGNAFEALLDRGARSLAVVGNDTSFDEAVAALMTRADHAELRLTIIPIEGSDLARTFGLPQDPVRASAHASSDSVYEMDVARVSTSAGDRVLVRVAGVGFSARMAAKERALPVALGRGRRFLAFWLGLAGSRANGVEVFVGDRSRFKEQAWDVTIGNCQFFGGGLRVSPRSFPGDGSIEALVSTGQRSGAFRKMPLMFNGEHVPSDDIFEFRGKTLRIESERREPVHVDGIPWGTTPVSLEVVPKAFLLSV
jgi:diacylglycerol kinase family enzyme